MGNWNAVDHLAAELVHLVADSLGDECIVTTDARDAAHDRVAAWLDHKRGELCDALGLRPS